jgi:hypothetical protein
MASASDWTGPVEELFCFAKRDLYPDLNCCLMRSQVETMMDIAQPKILLLVEDEAIIDMEVYLEQSTGMQKFRGPG